MKLIPSHRENPWIGNGHAGRVREPKQGDARGFSEVFERARSLFVRNGVAPYNERVGLFVPEKFVADEHAAATDNREDSALFANDFVNNAIRADDQLAESFKVVWWLSEASSESWPFHPCGK